MKVLDSALSEHILFRMSEYYVVLIADQEVVEALVQQGRQEVRWATCVGRMWHNQQYHQEDMDPLVFGHLLDQLVSAWPKN